MGSWRATLWLVEEGLGVLMTVWRSWGPWLQREVPGCSRCCRSEGWQVRAVWEGATCFDSSRRASVGAVRS